MTMINLGIAVAAGAMISGSGGGRTTGQRVQQEDLRTPEQLDLLNKILGLAGPGIGQPGRVPPSSLGPVGPSGLQRQAFGMARKMPGMFPSDIRSMMQPVGQYSKALFGQEMVPEIMSALGREGMARSGGAANILGKQARNLNLGLASQFAPMQLGLSQARAALPQQMANIGSLQRGIGGERQSFDLARYMQQDPMRSPAVNLGLQGIGIPTQENIAFQGFRQPSMMESLLPAVGTVVGGMAQGGTGFFSDERLKENIEPIKNALEKVKQLDGKVYKFKFKDKEKDGGLIAQEVERVLPEAVVEKEGIKYVKYEAVIALLVNAVNELYRKVG